MCCGILSSNCFSRACRFQEVNLQIFSLHIFSLTGDKMFCLFAMSKVLVV